MDLNALSLKELKDLQAQVTRAIASYEDRKKKEAIAELEDRARAFGYSLPELLGAMSVKKRAPASAKYVNPADPGDTWSGRGRKPRWFVAALQAGKSVEDLMV